MFDTLHHHTALPPSLVSVIPALPAFAPAIACHYQLVALMLGHATGQERPVLGQRWHLPVYEQLLQEPWLTVRQTQLAKPLVLRATLGESIATQVTNLMPKMPLRLAMVDDDFGILDAEGMEELRCGESQTLLWRCRHAGIYPIYNRASHDPVERRSLLGVLIIEP